MKGSWLRIGRSDIWAAGRYVELIGKSMEISIILCSVAHKIDQGLLVPGSVRVLISQAASSQCDDQELATLTRPIRKAHKQATDAQKPKELRKRKSPSIPSL